MDNKKLIEDLTSGKLEFVYVSPEQYGYWYCTVRQTNPEKKLASEEQIKETVSILVKTNKDKTEQVLNKPQQIGWFVGKTMQAFYGNADPRLVLKICQSEIMAFKNDIVSNKK